MNESIDRIDFDERLKTVFVINAFGIFGLAVSSIPLFLTCSTPLRKSLINIMVANLSIADLLICGAMTLGNTPYVLYRERLPEIGCQWLGFAVFTLAFQQCLFPGLISFNRYVALYRSASYRKMFTRNKVVVLIVCSWLVSAIAPAIFFQQGHTGFDEDNEHCCFLLPSRDETWTIVYWVGVVFPTMICGYGTICYCNYRLYKKLTDHAQTDVMCVNVVRQNKELLYFLWIDVIFPFTALGSYQILKYFVHSRPSIHFRRFMAVVYLSHAVVRGLLTLIMLRPYREAFKKMIRFGSGNSERLIRQSEEFRHLSYNSPREERRKAKESEVL